MVNGSHVRCGLQYSNLLYLFNLGLSRVDRELGNQVRKSHGLAMAVDDVWNSKLNSIFQGPRVDEIEYMVPHMSLSFKQHT